MFDGRGHRAGPAEDMVIVGFLLEHNASLLLVMQEFYQADLVDLCLKPHQVKS